MCVFLDCMCPVKSTYINNEQLFEIFHFTGDVNGAWRAQVTTNAHKWGSNTVHGSVVLVYEAWGVDFLRLSFIQLHLILYETVVWPWAAAQCKPQAKNR